MKTKLLIFDSVDVCGKSTFIANICKQFNNFQEVKFKKTLPSGDLLRINTEKDFELVFSLLELADKSKVYVFDRFLVSNLVYDKVLRGEVTDVSKRYYKELHERFDVCEIFLTRPPIQADFEDDRIKASKDQFNQLIEEYKKYGENYQLLDRDEFGNPTTMREAEAEIIWNKCFDLAVK